MYPPVTQLETHQRRLERRLPPPPSRDATVARSPAGPPRYKLALLTWTGAYAVITPVLALLGPVMASWPLAARTLVLSVTLVGSLTWFVMPRLTRLFRPWLMASS